jgi:putative transposase
MLKALKYRLYPNKEQKIVLDKHFGSVRFIYNLALETKKTAYYAGVNLSRYDLQVQLKGLKQDLEWLKEINSQSLQVALMNLDASYLAFFRGLKDGSIAKKKNNYVSSRLSKGLPIDPKKFQDIGKPKFKSKRDNNQSFNCPQSFVFEDGKLFIPKLKTGINIVLHRELKGEQRNITIAKTATGKYFVSVLVETGTKAPKLKKIKKETAVGVDLGIKTFAVCSDGKEIESPKYLRKSIDRIKVLQRRLSKKQRGSKNKEKASKRVAIVHEKIANQRKDFLHKESNLITKNYDTMCFEDLGVSNMVKNHNLAQSISDAGWGMFTQFVKYKSEWSGKNYIEIDRFDPSSKLHAECGYIYKELQLHEREWNCPKCNKLVHRDKNSAINIRNFAIKQTGAERSKEPVELPTLVGTLKQEIPLVMEETPIPLG